MIYGSAQFLVPASLLDVLILRRYRRNVPFALGCFFLRSSPGVDSTLTAVVADAVHGDVVDPSVVNVVDHGDVHVVHFAVIKKVSVIPAAAFVTMAEKPKP